ncbi:PP2C family protein-serine/threonine phosphatase [Streptomyces sp. NPDC090306]|uniref:PP2C family protein-serine/threonine phosphatase n=1 Tax=Streptomyces sp. NPDC090306 TaxID=3365961 RepID=UPI0037F71C64
MSLQSEAGAGDDSGRACAREELTAIADLLTEQRRRIAGFAGSDDRAGSRTSAAAGPGAGFGAGSLPEPRWQELMDAMPTAALLVAPVRAADGGEPDYYYVRHNTAARQYAETVIPPGTLPPRPAQPVPLFVRYPEMAGTPLPRMLGEAHSSGESQGPQPVEFSLRAPSGDAVRISADVRVVRCGTYLMCTWERGNRQALALAAQHLARTCWMEWNLTGQSPRASFGVRSVLGLADDASLPSLVDMAAMTDAAGGRLLHEVLSDVLLRGRTSERDLNLVTGHNRVLRFLAEPIALPDGPVWAVRGVMMDVTGDRLTRDRADRAEQEAQRAQHRVQALGEVAATLRKAVSPRFAGESARSGLETAAVYRPDSGARVGGDWFKARVLPSGRTLLALGDARGHGLGAVTLMAKLRYALAGLAFTERPVEKLTGWLNKVAYDDGPESTATAVVARYHPDRRLLRWVSAGHLPPILLRDGDARLLAAPPRSAGLSLGVLPDAYYTAVETVLCAGDVVLMYSDGLVERRPSDIDADTELLRHRAELLARDGIGPGRAGLQEYAERVVRAMTELPQTDDATLLAVRCTP